MENQVWRCSCGQENTGKYCAACGQMQPAARTKKYGRIGGVVILLLALLGFGLYQYYMHMEKAYLAECDSALQIVTDLKSYAGQDPQKHADDFDNGKALLMEKYQNLSRMSVPKAYAESNAKLIECLKIEYGLMDETVTALKHHENHMSEIKAKIKDLRDMSTMLFIDGRDFTEPFDLEVLGKNLESSSQTSGGSAAPQTAAVPSEPSYKHYVNRRYGFQVDYPADFIPGRQPANGDGLSFTSPDGQASLNVSAGHIFNTSLQKAYTNDLQRVQGSLGYHTAGDTWYVITWSDDRMIHYQKTFILGKTRDDMRFSYPIQQKGSYENVVSALESSFKSGRDD